jgi:undecaprenyl-diphosphatase
LWLAIAGAVLGDNLNFWLGARYGQRWRQSGVWFMKPQHFEQAHQFFDRHGARSIFLGRFIPSIKEIAPFIAGTVGMRRRTFFFWNVLGGVGWGLEWVGGGYLFGQSLSLAQAWMSRAGLAIFLLLLLWLLFYLLKRAVYRHGLQVWLLLVSLYRSIRRNVFVRRWVRQHPRTSLFLSQRFDRSHFKGFPLTLLVMAFVYVLALSAGIVEDFITADPIVAFDHATAEMVAHFRSTEVISVFIALTSLGVVQVVAPLLLASMVLLWLWQRPMLILPLLVSSVGASLFTFMGKLAFHRPRPMEAVLLEKSYSFPSGHATIAVALYGFIGYVLIRSAGGLKRQVNIFFVTAVLILLIGLSRIILGVHYVSDVWAGYLVGALWLIIGISLSEWLTSTGRLDWREKVSRTRKIWAAIILLLSLGWVTAFNLNWQPARFTPPSPPQIDIKIPLNRYLNEHDLAYTETLLGRQEQPLGLVFLANTEADLVQALQAAGWQQSDPITYRSIIKLVRQGMDYAAAPLPPAFWNNRLNDRSFERPVDHGLQRTQQTLRLWKTAWRFNGQLVFVAVARTCNGIQWGLLHHVVPDVDAATASVVQSLQRAGRIETFHEQVLVEPMIGKYLLGGSFFTHGSIDIVTAK